MRCSRKLINSRVRALSPVCFLRHTTPSLISFQLVLCSEITAPVSLFIKVSFSHFVRIPPSSSSLSSTSNWDTPTFHFPSPNHNTENLFVYINMQKTLMHFLTCKKTRLISRCRCLVSNTESETFPTGSIQTAFQCKKIMKFSKISV